MPTAKKEIRFGAEEVEYIDHIAELFGLKKENYIKQDQRVS